MNQTRLTIVASSHFYFSIINNPTTSTLYTTHLLNNRINCLINQWISFLNRSILYNINFFSPLNIMMSTHMPLNRLLSQSSILTNRASIGKHIFMSMLSFDMIFQYSSLTKTFTTKITTEIKINRNYLTLKQQTNLPKRFISIVDWHVIS